MRRKRELRQGTSRPRKRAAGVERKIWWALLLNAGLAVGQVFVSIRAGSVAVLADAAHQGVDALGLALSGLSLRLRRLPASDRRTFGWQRADAVGAQLSGVLLSGALLWVVWESIHRLFAPSEVSGGPVILIGLIGMAVNGGSALAIGRAHDHQLSVRAARLHLLGDFAGSAVVLVSGLLLQAFAWDRIDPIASLLVTALAARSMIGLLCQSTDVLLDAVPAGIAVDRLRADILAIPGVNDLHHLHVWSMGPGQPALSAHLSVDGNLNVHDAQEHAQAVRDVLHTHSGIDHVTVEIECHPCLEPDHVDEPDSYASHTGHSH